MTHQDSTSCDWLDDAYLDDPLHEEDYHWGPWGGYEGDTDPDLEDEWPEPVMAAEFVHKLDDCPFDQSKGG